VLPKKAGFYSLFIQIAATAKLAFLFPFHSEFCNTFSYLLYMLSLCGFVYLLGNTALEKVVSTQVIFITFDIFQVSHHFR
tara:strand:- start:168 stop:407 length:240 start_codon:yes stop_codon:yes gene_type:complete